MDEEKYNRKLVGSSTPLSSRMKSKSKHERDLPYSPPGQTKRSYRESKEMTSEEEEDDDNTEFDEDNDEQCTLHVNLSQSVRESSASSFSLLISNLRAHHRPIRQRRNEK